jgi:hypothetical protein
MTREGTKLTADVATELIEKLYQAEPACSILLEQLKNQANSQPKVNTTKPENIVADLIQNDYLTVIDPVDG